MTKENGQGVSYTLANISALLRAIGFTPVLNNGKETTPEFKVSKNCPIWNEATAQRIH